MPQTNNEPSFSFSLNTGMSEPVTNMPYGLIGSIEIREDAMPPKQDPFTFIDLLLLAQADPGEVIAALHDRVRESIDVLRLLFTMELDLIDAPVPPTWDEMDIFFRQWLSERITESEEKVTPAYKAEWEAMDHNV